MCENLIQLKIRRRACIRASLITYLRQESRLRSDRVDRVDRVEDVRMKTTVFRKTRSLRQQLAEVKVENTALKEMIGECDIDVFTHQQTIQTIQRANHLYVQNLILDKRKRSNRYSSELKLDLYTHRELVQAWRCQARDWRDAHNIASNGFFYPILKPNQLNPPPPPTHSAQPSTPKVVHYHHHTHHIHHHAEPPSLKNSSQSCHSG